MQALLRHRQFKINLLQVAVGLLFKNGSLLGRAIGIIYVYASDVGFQLTLPNVLEFRLEIAYQCVSVISNIEYNIS